MVKKRKAINREKIKIAQNESWYKLFKFMDENDFSIQDFLACACANFLRYTETNYTTMLSVGNQDFLIQIDKICGEKRL